MKKKQSQEKPLAVLTAEEKKAYKAWTSKADAWNRKTKKLHKILHLHKLEEMKARLLKQEWWGRINEKYKIDESACVRDGKVYRTKDQ